MAEIKDRYDGLVIGGGIAGMQAALDLAGQGFQVLLVERQPSIGGIMVGLNKVFPTLDCSSCICTPRMAEVAHHERIHLVTYTDVLKVEPTNPGFRVRLLKKPRYVVESECIGCSLCELACDTMVAHEFDYQLGARRAIYIPHANAIPQVAVLDPDHCTFDGACARVCPKDCIDFSQMPEEVTVDVGTVIVSSGLQITPMGAKKEYGGNAYVNVMNPLAMERVQSSNGPYGHVLRPFDGKVPRSIAYVQCAGSRDASIGVPYCSRVCCMYALKQAIMIRHELHDTEVTIYYMDIRAFGKGYEQFYRRALAEGINVVKAKVARITEVDDHDLSLRVELIDEGGRLAEIRHDLVVLSQGVIPGWNSADVLPITEARDHFFEVPELATKPARSTVEGIFLAGVSTGPKDIPDAIVEAGAAAMEAAMYLDRTKEARERASVAASLTRELPHTNGAKRLPWKESLRVFRERMGGVTDEKKIYLKNDKDARKAVRETLRSGSRTIPELTHELDMPGESVMWYVMALKRYGEVVEAGRSGDYLRYALKEVER